MIFDSRLNNYDNNELLSNFENILYDEEFLDDNGDFLECYFCESDDIYWIKKEYATLDNYYKMKIKNITLDIKYHEFIKIEYCDNCGEILRITKENKEKIYNK